MTPASALPPRPKRSMVALLRSDRSMATVLPAEPGGAA